MILGEPRDVHPYVQLAVGDSSIEFLVDTGYEGDLTLPADQVVQICGPPAGAQIRWLADGSRVALPVHTVELCWLGEDRLTEVLALDGPPLLGTEFLSGCELHVQVTAHGEVTIEPL